MKPQRPDDQPSIAAAVIVHGDRVLLVRRRLAEGSLSWQLPAGAVEPGESAEAAAVREASEEVGVVVRPLSVLGHRVHPATGRNMVYILCELMSGEARVTDTDELAELAWSTKGDLTRYVPTGLYPPVQEYLENILAA